MIWLRVTADLLREIQPLVKAVVKTKDFLGYWSQGQALRSLGTDEVVYLHLTKSFFKYGLLLLGADITHLNHFITVQAAAPGR